MSIEVNKGYLAELEEQNSGATWRFAIYAVERLTSGTVPHEILTLDGDKHLLTWGILHRSSLNSTAPAAVFNPQRLLWFNTSSELRDFLFARMVELSFHDPNSVAPARVLDVFMTQVLKAYEEHLRQKADISAP